MKKALDERTADSKTTDAETATETALEEAERRFHAVFDVNPAPALIIRLFDERVELVNSGLTDLVGYERHELQGRSLPDLDLFVDKQQREELLELPRRLQQVSKTETRLRSRSGDEKVALISVKPLEYNDQTCAILTFADVTEQKQAEEHFVKMFHLSPVPSSLITLEGGRFVNANRSFFELTGYNKAEVSNRTGQQLGLWPVNEERHALDESLRRQSGFRDLPFQLRTKAGDIRHVLASAEVLDDDTDVLLVVLYDVTDRRQTEERLRRAIQEVMNDATSLTQQVMERFINLKPGSRPPEAVLSDLNLRERQVLQCVARGLSNDAIATELGLATQTVRNYVSSVYDKLGVRTRVEAAVWARERGLADTDT